MYKNKRILAVTLARGGSKSIPFKNIVNINGYPLLYYTIKEALKCSLIDNYIVSSDSDKIIDIAKSLGANCPFKRPSNISSDTATSAEALLHALLFLEERGEKYDYVVELMATNPLKIKNDIVNCIKLAIDANHHSVVAVNELSDHHPSRIKYLENGKLKPFYKEVPESRRQDLSPTAYIRSGSIYVTSCEFLQQQKSRYSEDDTLAYILPNERVINIDDPIDLEIARQKLK